MVEESSFVVSSVEDVDDDVEKVPVFDPPFPPRRKGAKWYANLELIRQSIAVTMLALSRVSLSTLGSRIMYTPMPMTTMVVRLTTAYTPRLTLILRR